jgi:hypothetical protein
MTSQGDCVGRRGSLTELNTGGRHRENRCVDAHTVHHRHVFVGRPCRYAWKPVGLVDAGGGKRLAVLLWNEVGVDVDQWHAVIL